ncbi:PIN domain-containing protein [Streptomyces sp. NPDC004647]|uniref:PIN domain-containing protein n=1 Tax=Streptomyces sp. NPDC004647 TaxID=3154671 RepID=UPI0033A41703
MYEDLLRRDVPAGWPPRSVPDALSCRDEFLYSARSTRDREEIVEDLKTLFGWAPVDDRAYVRAWEVQQELTAPGRHRSAGPVDLVVAATAELQGLTILHYDVDFETIAETTGQASQWLMPPGSL